jgi:hypothetical protein
MSSFLRSFLDGFTGAGVTRRLAVPGEPIPGFAPTPGAFPEMLLDDVRNRDLQIHFGKRRLRLRVLDIQIDNKSGNLLWTVKSDSGKVREFRVEGDLLSQFLTSQLDGSAR